MYQWLRWNALGERLDGVFKYGLLGIAGFVRFILLLSSGIPNLHQRYAKRILHLHFVQCGKPHME